VLAEIFHLKFQKNRNKLIFEEEKILFIRHIDAHQGKVNHILNCHNLNCGASSRYCIKTEPGDSYVVLSLFKFN
jgi:hypothetical protein